MNEIKSIYKDNNEIKYGIIHGGNKPFVMIPGISLASVLININGIKGAYSQLLDRYTIYVFDHASPKTDNFSMNDMVNDLIYSLDTIGLKNITLYGVSIGGMIALKTSILRPELIEKMIIVASSATVDEKQEVVLRDWEKMSNNYDIENLNRSFFTTMFTKDFVANNNQMLDSFIHNGTKQECECFSRVIRTMYGFDISKEIKNVEIPSYILGSDEDPIFGQRASEKIAEALKGELFIYRGYSHAFYDEARDFLGKLSDWLNK